jgi:hypothetical protein
MSNTRPDLLDAEEVTGSIPLPPTENQQVESLTAGTGGRVLDHLSVIRPPDRT